MLFAVAALSAQPAAGADEPDRSPKVIGDVIYDFDSFSYPAVDYSPPLPPDPQKFVLGFSSTLLILVDEYEPPEDQQAPPAVSFSQQGMTSLAAGVTRTVFENISTKAGGQWSGVTRAEMEKLAGPGYCPGFFGERVGRYIFEKLADTSDKMETPFVFRGTFSRPETIIGPAASPESCAIAFAYPNADPEFSTSGVFWPAADVLRKLKKDALAGVQTTVLVKRGADGNLTAALPQTALVLFEAGRGATALRAATKPLPPRPLADLSAESLLTVLEPDIKSTAAALGGRVKEATGAFEK